MLEAAAAKDEILEHLRAVLASWPFRKNRRARIYLHFVVTETVEGRAEQLSEASIARVVFGHDSSRVRDKSDDVHRRLSEYYSSHRSESPVWFALDWVSPAPCIGPWFPPRPPWPGSQPLPSWDSRVRWSTIIALALALSNALTLLFRYEPGRPSIWDPFLDQSKPVILCEPSPAPAAKVLKTAFAQSRSVPTVDASEGPVILFAGCELSPPGSSLTGGLRYRQTGTELVTDSQSGTRWRGALVTRILAASGNHPAVVIEGSSQFNSQLLRTLKDNSGLTRALGDNWQRSNFQIVIGVDPAGTPSEIVAGYTW